MIILIILNLRISDIIASLNKIYRVVIYQSDGEEDIKVYGIPQLCNVLFSEINYRILFISLSIYFVYYQLAHSCVN